MCIVYFPPSEYTFRLKTFEKCQWNKWRSAYLVFYTSLCNLYSICVLVQWYFRLKITFGIVLGWLISGVYSVATMRIILAKLAVSSRRCKWPHICIAIDFLLAHLKTVLFRIDPTYHENASIYHVKSNQKMRKNWNKKLHSITITMKITKLNIRMIAFSHYRWN